MSDRPLQVPEGLRDIPVEECATKRCIENRIRKVFTAHGYHEVYTPTFEYMDLFYRGDFIPRQEEMYKFLDNDGNIVVARPDVTVPIARMVSTKMKEAAYPLKLFYLTEVFRMSQAQSGKEREFTQAGVEVIGIPGVGADGEIIAVSIESLIAAGLEEFRIDIGQVQFLESIVREIGIPDRDKEKLRYYTQHRNLDAVEGLLDHLGINGKYKEILLSVPVLFGEVEEILSRASSFPLNEGARQALANIEEVYSIIKDYGYQKYVWADLGMVNRFDYYTGIIFKGFTRDLGYIICSGGRYDNLLRQFGNDCPATGFAINVNRVARALKNQNWQEDYREKYYILTYSREDRKKAIETAQKLRKAGLFIEMDICRAGINKLKVYAREKGIRHIVLLREGNSLEVMDVKRGTSKVTSLHGVISSLYREELKNIAGWH